DEEFKTLPVEYSSLIDVISATGILQPESVTPLGSELSGKVIEVGAELNQDVVKGQVLLKLDDRSAQATLEAARIAVQKARQGLKLANVYLEKAQYGVDQNEKVSNRAPVINVDVA